MADEALFDYLHSEIVSYSLSEDKVSGKKYSFFAFFFVKRSKCMIMSIYLLLLGKRSIYN